MSNPIDAEPDISVHVPHEIIAMLHETVNDRAAVDLMDLVMEQGGAGGPRRA